MSITVPSRHIPAAAVHDAATMVYGAAVRTPLVRIDLAGTASPLPELYLKLELLQPIGSFKIRGAYNVVSRSCRRTCCAQGVWTVSAGNAAQGVALAARKVGARCSVMVMDTAPDTKIAAIERLGATIVRASYDECWRTVESTRSASHARALRASVRRRSLHRRQRHRWRSRFSRICPTSTRSSRRSAAAGCSSGIAAAVARVAPARRVFAAEPETAAPLAASLAAGRPVYFDDWKASFVDGAGGKSVLDDDVAAAPSGRGIDRRLARRGGARR